MCSHTPEGDRMSRGTPTTSIRISKRERAELQTLARKTGVSVADAMRTGGRIYLETLAVTQDQARMGRRPAA
jgi:hypothetical protein